MRITYVLPYPELNGGNKVIFQHARLLAEGGDEVTVLGQGPRPDWFPWRVYHDYAAAPVPALPAQDMVIATYWTTVSTARDLALGPLAHFCQGYEGDLVHLGAQRPAIEAVYRQPLPTLTVTPHLAQLLDRRFGRRSRVVPPPIDPLFRPWRGPRPPRPRRRPWLAIPGIFEAAVKDVPTALEAVRVLRAAGVRCRVLRFSIFPLSAAEASLLAPDRVLTAVPPNEIARALRRCDLLFLASRPGEGFGLPLLEAMASGVPAVASRLPSTEFLTAGAVPLVEPGESAAFASAARRLLSDRGEWHEARRRGIEASRRFRAEAVGPTLREAVRWAAAAASVAAPGSA